MRIADFLEEHPTLHGQLRGLLDEMVEPDTLRPPQTKGKDAIVVHGYFVRGHWRRRWYPVNGHKRKRKEMRV